MLSFRDTYTLFAIVTQHSRPVKKRHNLTHAAKPSRFTNHEVETE